MKRDISRFDMSDYTVDNVYGIPLTNKKSDLMKDENNGAIMTGFVGLEQRCTPYVSTAKKIDEKSQRC